MDFYRIRIKESKGFNQAYPDWVVDNSEDLMVRGGAFYAVWNPETGMWSTNEYDVQRTVDEDLKAFVEKAKVEGQIIEPLLTRNFGSGSWEKFNRYIRNLPSRTGYHQLDEKITFANTEVKKTDYVSKRLPYSLVEGRTDAWDELLSTLYAPEERDKIEWAIGSIVAGDSRWIQKFVVFYGPPGSGKSTVIGIIERLFEGYVATFEAKALTSSASAFSMEAFESNPLVAIQHDGDLSRIEDNTRLNSIVGHDSMNINVKYRSAFTIKPNAFLIMGTNKPVKITDAKAGNTRRLIDIHPTGVKIDPGRYHILMENVNFELGAIANKCLNRYREMGKYYYEGYIPVKMMMLTDTFYNFVEAHYDIFKSQDAIQLKNVWELYKQYCEESNILKRLQHHEVRDELSNYFWEFKDRHYLGDKEYRSVYVGFKGLPEQGPTPVVPDTSYVIEFEEIPSAFDHAYGSQPAQLTKADGTPKYRWENVKTTLDDIDTSLLHYVKVPENHIVLDFDLVDEDGNKDIGRNIEEASKYPPTYSELSKSGSGLHLHYIYTGDVTELKSYIAEGIEVKTLLGDSSLRRKLTKCNSLDIATLSAGLPKKEKRVIDAKQIQSEKGLRLLVERNLRKEIHPGTKPSIDFIAHILEDAYNSGMSYDLVDLRSVILSFALGSTHHAKECLDVVHKMKFVGKQPAPEVVTDDKPIVFYDVEVYPNLFIVCWKYAGSDTVVRMINPTGEEIEPLFKQKLVGFNNRRYDNHILFARYLGHTLEDLFNLSQKIIYNDKSDNSSLFGEAYNLSYADIYEFASKKQSLKKFQIELGIPHKELDLPWDKPVPEEKWGMVEDYCVNDVRSTEVVFNSRTQDFEARCIIAEMSGLSVNHTTQSHAAKILFGEDKNPNAQFIYTDLSNDFPGYVYDGGSSHYRGEITGEGGYVYAEPGYYEDVTVLDVVSMHPSSIVALRLFGDYTDKFVELIDRRVEAKRNGETGLSNALKLVINSIYGYTSARFPNMFKDNRNKDNIVAKRGALFMIDLKHAVQEKGFTVAHIKTDSIKIPGATLELIDFICEMGKNYGYVFEEEDHYEKFCLVNDAVYVARSHGVWSATGAQFQHPYVFKTLFSGEPITFGDYCETKNVTKGRMYLGPPEGVTDADQLRHVGRTGSFVPVTSRGGILWRVQDDKFYHVVGTKNHLWIDTDVATHRESENDLEVDMSYFNHLVDEAIKTIEAFVPYSTLKE